jgi:DNA-binding CsgD family transcriptional regulator
VRQAGLVGREPELGAAGEFLAGLRAGPRGLVIEGEAGIGKTAVWRAALAEAEASGCRVLQCVAEQAEARLSFVGLTDLAADVADELLPALPAPQREALEVVLLRGAGRAPDPKAVGMGLRSLLVEAAPVVVAIDDAQWLDPGTARALAFAIRRLAGHRVGILATLRVPGADALGLERALGTGFTRARVGPLGEAALRALIERRLGFAYTRPALLRIAQLSGGNPLFALEIARALGPAPALAAGAALPVPDSLRELVAGRVGALGRPARAALLAAAALSHPTVELVELAACPQGLVEAEESGLLALEGGRLQFAHPLYASAVYAAAASGRRRALHARLAELVADPEECARHRALAATGPDEDVAAALAAAAAVARARGAWETAGELLEQARALTPPERPEAARERGVRAAEHHIHAGDRPRARELLEALLADAPPGTTRADTLRLLAEIRYHEDGFAEAATLLEEARRQAEDPALLVSIELNLCYVRANHLSDYAGARPHADRAHGHAARAGDRGLLAEALCTRAVIDFLTGRGVDWNAVTRSLELEDPDRMVPVHLRPSANAACLKLWAGRHDEARTELYALREAAAVSGDESDLAYTLCWLAWLETLSGDFAAAGALAADAAVRAAAAGSEFNRGWALALSAVVAAHRGEAEAVRADAAAAAKICERFQAPNPMLWATAALGLLELSLGDTAAAWAALAPIVERLEAEGIGEPLVVLPYALEALIALGELERAERLLAGFERRARELDRVWALATSARCRGLLLAAQGDLDGALAALERALAAHGRLDLPFELARTLLVQGQLLRRRRQKKAAHDALERALTRFDRMGAELWAQRARDELGRLTRRSRGPGELTQAERRVTDLAARGLANKEIAQELFVTVHTVEVHLSRAYAKLGVRSRAQLVAATVRAS